MEFIYSDNPKHSTILIEEIKKVDCLTFGSNPKILFLFKDGSEYAWWFDDNASQDEVIALYKKVQEALPGKMVTTKRINL